MKPRKAQLSENAAIAVDKARIFRACVDRLCESAGVIQLTSAGKKVGYRGSHPDDARAVHAAVEYGHMAAGLFSSFAVFEASSVWMAIRDLPCSPRFLQWQARSDENAGQPEQPINRSAAGNKANPGVTKGATKMARAIALRDLAIAVVRQTGAWDRVTRDLEFRVTSYRAGDLLINLRTPLQRGPVPPVPQPAEYLATPGEAAAPENLPYGIWVCWCECAHFDIEWDDDDRVCLRMGARDRAPGGMTRGAVRCAALSPRDFRES
jgi:hypothetical protein